MFKAVWNQKIIAESNQTVEVEGNQYFPREDVNQQYLKPSPLKTVCPWKGDCSYYDVVVDGKVNSAAAWYYPNPKEAAIQIKDRIAFWKDIDVFEE